MATTFALVPFASAIVDHAEALGRATLRATEAIWPASILQGGKALLLSPKGLNEIGEGKTPPGTGLCSGAPDQSAMDHLYYFKGLAVVLPGRAELSC